MKTFKKHLCEKQIWDKEVSPNIQEMLINLKHRIEKETKEIVALLRYNKNKAVRSDDINDVTNEIKSNIKRFIKQNNIL